MGYIQSVSKYGKVDLAWNDEPGRAGSRAARSGGYRLEISAGNKRHVIGSDLDVFLLTPSLRTPLHTVQI